jgi:hypothetical protein
MKLTAITLDCPDPVALATFYQQATGFKLHPQSVLAAVHGEHGWAGRVIDGEHRGFLWSSGCGDRCATTP